MNKHSISYLLNDGPPPSTAVDAPADGAAADGAATTPADVASANPLVLRPVNYLCDRTPTARFSPDTVSDWASCIPSPEASEPRPDPPAESPPAESPQSPPPPPPPPTLAPLVTSSTRDALTFHRQATGIWLPLLPAPLASMAVAGDMSAYVPRMMGGWAPLGNPPPLLPRVGGSGVPAGTTSISSSMGVTAAPRLCRLRRRPPRRSPPRPPLASTV